MTAGHCFEQRSPRKTKFNIDTTSGGNTPAAGVSYEFGKRGDYGVLELGNGHRGETKMTDGLHVVEAIQEPVEGAAVCKYGATTERTCGEISKVNVYTLLEYEGKRIILKGMTRATFCLEKGDSGAPVYAEFNEGTDAFSITAVGIASTGVEWLIKSKRNHVCGEKVGQPNESYFTPLSSIDSEGKFHVKIKGG